jgi:hypothetical protein
MKDFKVSAAVGEESTTDGWFRDAAGKSWPIYSKVINVPALPNATTTNYAHGVATIKLDGHFKVRSLTASSGTGGATARTNKNSAGLSFTFDGTNVSITAAANLSAQAGQIIIEYCKTTD